MSSAFDKNYDVENPEDEMGKNQSELSNASEDNVINNDIKPSRKEKLDQNQLFHIICTNWRNGLLPNECARNMLMNHNIAKEDIKYWHKRIKQFKNQYNAKIKETNQLMYTESNSCVISDSDDGDWQQYNNNNIYIPCLG